jgi:CO/xanthine dehydrogenase Mo-binding subunit
MPNASAVRRPEVPYVGRSVPRVEDLRFITGRGHYSDDVRIDGEVHCTFVRSPYSHAKIVTVDTTAAHAMPGVLAVLTGHDYVDDGCHPVDHAPIPLMPSTSGHAHFRLRVIGSSTNRNTGRSRSMLHATLVSRLRRSLRKAPRWHKMRPKQFVSSTKRYRQ